MNITQTLRIKYQNLITDQRFSEILTGSAYALAARIVAVGLAMVSSIIIARVYGPEALGTLAVVNSFIMLATVFTVFGTNTSILRLIPEYISKYSVHSAFKVYRKTQNLVAGLSLITGVSLFFASGFIADHVFSKPHFSFLLALASLFLVFSSLSDLNTQAVRGLKLIRVFAFMQVLPSAAMLLALGVMTVLTYHRNNPVYAQLASFGITAVFGALIMDYAFKKESNAAGVSHELPVKQILSLSSPMFMTAAFGLLIGQTGIIILGIYRTEAEVGYYSIAVKLATLTSFVLQAINSIAAPRFAELYHQNKMQELFYVAKKSTRLIFWTTAPILLCLLVMGKPILALFFGDRFTAAYVPMIFLVFGQFVNTSSGSTGNFMNMTGNHKYFRNILFAATFISVCLNLVLIPRFGINGAAFVGMVVMIFWNIYTLAYIKAKYGHTIGYFPFTSG